MLESLNYSFRNPKNIIWVIYRIKQLRNYKKNHGVFRGPQLDKQRWRARLGILRINAMYIVVRAVHNLTFLLPWRKSINGPGSPHCRGFTITFRYTTLGMNPMDEESDRRRELYLTTHNTHKRQISMPPPGFEPIIPASKRPQTHALDRAATGIGHNLRLGLLQTKHLANSDQRKEGHAPTGLIFLIASLTGSACCPPDRRRQC